MSSDSSSLLNALGPETHSRPPESPEDYYQHQYNFIEPSGMDIPPGKSATPLFSRNILTPTVPSLPHKTQNPNPKK